MEDGEESDDRVGSPSLEIARSAYGDMLHDTERNLLYERGIKWAIETVRARGVQQVIVLDIGTGSGLLSMLAARHGADLIYACDAFKPVIEVARKVIASNGYGDKVKLIPSASFDVTVGPGCDMETRAHILVTELFDTELVGEGAIKAYSDAYERLLLEDCIMVPQDATIYVQVVRSKFLRQHHAVDPHGIEVTDEIRNCLGTASLHDLQLSQLQPGVDFEVVTQPTETFHFDFKHLAGTDAHFCLPIPEIERDACVLMWWDCSMSPDVVLSCAPFWAHPDGEKQAWRDHWMQAVYYPRRSQGKFLSCCRDEFSFWFDITTSGEIVEMPLCTCGIHFTTPRSRIAQLGDRSYIESLKRALESTPEEKIVFIGQSMFSLPLVLAKEMPHKSLHVLDTGSKSSEILEQLLKLNTLDNCVPYKAESSASHIFAEPFFNECLLPWDHWFRLRELKESRVEFRNRKLSPSHVRIMLMAVELEHLWKIRAPIQSTVGLDMKAYDEFIQLAISSCDSDVEPQPLWEYPCIAKSLPELLILDPESDQTVEVKRPVESNGLALWAEYDFGATIISTGPQREPRLGERVIWNRFVKQAIIIDAENRQTFSINF